MTNLALVAETDRYTVVGSYEPEKQNSLLYESEADLEKRFISLLASQGYEYLHIKSEADLIANLRKRLEELNCMKFTDSEWERFFKESIANAKDSILDKTRKIQIDHIQNLIRDDGTTKNVRLLDKKQIHNNVLQVINQYEAAYTAPTGPLGEGREAGPVCCGVSRSCRYDVTILVNGLPLVHVELKRRGVAIREAFNQICRYSRDSFWGGSGLFNYVQLFVISNGTHTKYYSNTTRKRHIDEVNSAAARRKADPSRKFSSNSFEFTSWWADSQNRNISDLVDFTKTFFSRHVLLNILIKYCVFDTSETLLVMRPYQIAATERILSRLNIAENQKWEGTVKGGGYIWHTTGSGKTLTSFKTAILASMTDGIDKVLFVVDRSDLDYQTIKEYDRFQKGAANSNKSTKILEAQLSDPNAKIIITTIQKLGIFVTRTREHSIYRSRVVIVFDECHRSQFGELHRKITKAFKRYHLFGFTGTPIFAANAPSAGSAFIRTTEEAFGEQLHAYTIVDAIRDGNVLPFRISTVNTLRHKRDIKDARVAAIDTEEALMDPRRISAVVKYILENFDRITYSRFNSILAVSSIPAAMKYYDEFKRQMSSPDARKLKIATIFTFSQNEDDVEDGYIDEGGDPSQLPKQSRDFLDKAIADYNKMFGSAYDTSADSFQNYYRDLSLKVKNRQVDILIVVNMFLTGFDATTLNTLWVDKNLKMHGLIQAFSRTNRILDSVKKFGSIVCFRDLQKATDDAIALFGDKSARGVVLMRTFADYMNGYKDDNGNRVKGYKDLVAELAVRFPDEQSITGEKSERGFIALWGAVLKMRNILCAFDEFEANELLPERARQDYQSRYLDLYGKLRSSAKADKESIVDDIVFEMELVKQVDVNIDYILMLVEKHAGTNRKDKELSAAIDKAVGSSFELRSKKELIEAFVAEVNGETEVASQWRAFVERRKREELASLVAKENLRPLETMKFFNNALRDGVLRTSGTDIDLILPPMSRFGSSRQVVKDRVVEALEVLFERYKGISFAESDDVEPEDDEAPTLRMREYVPYLMAAEEPTKPE